ncbi:MAG: hypothetical protein PHG64_13680 [Paludibacter sp.]|nr:hypothetical protein [Paludibacter sp.]
MRKIMIFTGLVFVLFSFFKCQEEDMFNRFYPEILFMKAIPSGDEGQDWIVDPDFKEINLLSGETEFLLKARVSAPNKLEQIELINLSADDAVLQTITDFESSSNVKQIEFLVSNISGNTNLLVQAIDMKGNVTKRIFAILKN